MARRDIKIDAVYGDVIISQGNAKTTYSGTYLGVENLYAQYEVVVPINIAATIKNNKGIYVYLPYSPVFKPAKIRFVLDNKYEIPEYYKNPVNGGDWFDLVLPDKTSVYTNNLHTINGEHIYFLNISQDNVYVTVYSGDNSDFIIRESLQQNKIMLLKAMAGNIYQYPTTGVGLVNFLHSNFEQAGLGNKLQSEFTDDKMIIDDADINSESGELNLNVREVNNG